MTAFRFPRTAQLIQVCAVSLISHQTATAQDVGPLPAEPHYAVSPEQEPALAYARVFRADDGQFEAALPVSRTAYTALMSFDHSDHTYGFMTATGDYSGTSDPPEFMVASRDAPISAIQRIAVRDSNPYYGRAELLVVSAEGPLPNARERTILRLQFGVPPDALETDWTELSEVSPEERARRAAYGLNTVVRVHPDEPLQRVITFLEVWQNDAQTALPVHIDLSTRSSRLPRKTQRTASRFQPADMGADLLRGSQKLATIESGRIVSSSAGRVLAQWDDHTLHIASGHDWRSYDLALFNAFGPATTPPEGASQASDSVSWMWSRPVSPITAKLALHVQDKWQALPLGLGDDLSVNEDGTITLKDTEDGAWGVTGAKIGGSLYAFDETTRVDDDGVHCKLQPEAPWTATLDPQYFSLTEQPDRRMRSFHGSTRELSLDTAQARTVCIAALTMVQRDALLSRSGTLGANGRLGADGPMAVRSVYPAGDFRVHEAVAPDYGDLAIAADVLCSAEARIETTGRAESVSFPDYPDGMQGPVEQALMASRWVAGGNSSFSLSFLFRPPSAFGQPSL